jgi:hypothetical protein
MRKGDWVKYRHDGIDRTGIVQEIYMDGSYPKVVVKHPEFININTLYYPEVCEIPKPIPLQVGMIIRISGRDLEVLKISNCVFSFRCGYVESNDTIDAYYAVMQYPPSLESLVAACRGYRLNKFTDGSYELTKVICAGPESKIREYIREA